MDKSVLRVKQYFDLVANEDVPINYAEIVRLANMDFVVALAELESKLCATIDQQRAGNHPAPCARACEATAFAIEIRQLKTRLAERDARIKELEARLEVSPDHPYDGIACRDETIRLLDEKVSKLEADLAAARSQQVTEGWQLVPKEPTPKMVEAGYDLDFMMPDRKKVVGAYRAMLAAAPQPEQGANS